MGRTKQQPLNQLEIAVPRQPTGLLAKAKLTEEDKAELYQQQMGYDARQRQEEALRFSRRCTCANGFLPVYDKYGKPKIGKNHLPVLRFVVNWRLHEVGCPYVPVGGKK